MTINIKTERELNKALKTLQETDNYVISNIHGEIDKFRDNIIALICGALDEYENAGNDPATLCGNGKVTLIDLKISIENK